MAGLLDQARQWMTPERAIAMQGIGLGFSQLGAGQPVNLSPALDALNQRRQQAQMRKVMDQPGVMDRFSPQQRAALAAMPEGLATKILMDSMFAPPPKAVDGVQIVTGPDAERLGLDPTARYEVTRNPDGTLKNVSAIGSPTTTINVGPTGIDYGNPPTDMAWVRNPDGTVRMDERGAPMAAVVGGSKTDTDRVNTINEMAGSAIDAANKKASNDETKGRAGNVVLDDINRFRKLVKSDSWYNPATGLGASVASNVGGSNAANGAELALAIKSNIGFDRITQMRNDSPSGGGLGNVSDKDIAALQAVLGSLSQSQSEEQLLYNLDRLETIYTDMLKKLEDYPDAEKYGFAKADPENKPTVKRLKFNPETGELE